MRIAYLSQYFPPEVGAPQARVHELSREWVRLGHEVTVLTAFAQYPLGRKQPGDQYALTRRERLDGIDVLRTYIWATPNEGTMRRMASYASFATSAALIGRLRLRRPDVLIATSPQLLCGVAGYALARSLRVPFVFEVRDLWPESIIAVDAMGENAFVKALRRVAAHLYDHADLVVPVGEGYRRNIHDLYGLPLDRMAVIPNGIDVDLFVPGERDNDVRRQHGWGDKFVLMYVGTHGMAHGLSTILDAASTLRDTRAHFVLVGEGAEKVALKQRAAELRLGNVEFVDKQPKERIPAYYAACDLGVVTLRDTPLFQEVLPSKIFEYLGMERPLLLEVGGEARRLVEAAGAGEYVPPGNATAMARAVRRLDGERAQLTRMGQLGREYVLRNYNRRALAVRYLEALARVATTSSPRAPL